MRHTRPWEVRRFQSMMQPLLQSAKACHWSCPLQVLNNRFQVLQEMLDMLRDHQNNFHTAR